MAYMLQDRSAFARAQAATRTTDPQDPKPLNLLGILIKRGNNHVPADRKVPEAILKAFCPGAEIQTNSITRERGVVLKDVSLPAVNRVLAWMKDCSDANQVLHFPRCEYAPYFSYIQVQHVAKALKFDGLDQEMQKRTERLLTSQVHTDDVRMVYKNFPAEGSGSLHRKLVSSSIARAVQGKCLKAAPAVKKVQVDIPAFHEDVLSNLPEEFKSQWVKASDAAPKKTNKTQKDNDDFSLNEQDFPGLGK